MASKQSRIGALETMEDVKIAIRDLENVLSQLTGEGVTTLDDAPASPSVVVRKADGTYEVWDVVSGGGCTITKDAVNKRISISVP